jgi:nucleoid-associated protein YgaU
MATLGALEKLTIVAFSDSKVLEPVGAFVAMYNPSTFSVNHTASFDEGKEPLKANAEAKQTAKNPRTLSMELFFDGTGTSPSSNFSGGSSSVILGSALIKGALSKLKTNQQVSAIVDDFLKLSFDIDGSKHRSAFLVFIWGSFLFSGVLTSANVTYSLFAPDGKPLRAKISISANEHVDLGKLNLILKLKSPDLTHSRTIIAGDTLPNLAKKVYGDEKLYLEVARVNDLHNYRKLKPGMQLIFPPIEKIKTRG